MEYEIDDDPQGQPDEPEGSRDGGVMEDHPALRNRSSAHPHGYSRAERDAQSLASERSR